MNGGDNEIKRVVILGATGLIGGTLLRFLKSLKPRFEVIAPTRGEIDLLASESVSALAALLDSHTSLVFSAAIKKQLGNTLELYEKNLLSTLNVLRAIESASPAQVVYLSSTAVYGEDLDRTGITEDSALSPRSFYGLSKDAAEKLLLHAYGEVSKGRLMILRPPLIYGSNERGDSYGPVAFARRAKTGEMITLWGDGSELREFVHVNDLVKVVASVVEHRSEGILNVVSGTSRTFQDIISIVGRLHGDVKVESKPRSKAKADHQFIRSTSSLLRDLPFTTLEEGVAEVYHSWEGKQ